MPERGLKVVTYTRHASCAKGHGVEVSFSWEADAEGNPKEYSQPCPAPGCDALVAGKLPVGADLGTLGLSVAP